MDNTPNHSDAQTAALRLLAKGISVIPIPYGKKESALPWKRNQSEFVTEDDVNVWFAKPSNYGIVTGSLSEIAAIDADSPEAVEFVEKTFPTPWSQRTAKGKHFLYRHPGGHVPTKAGLMVDGFKLDVRGDGGYILGPFSTHPTGAIYTIEKPWTVCSKADLPPFPMEIFGEQTRSATEQLSKIVASSASLEELRDLLSRKDPSCGYDAWIRTGMCVHHESNGSDEGFTLWDVWSAASPKKYSGTDQLKVHWRSFGNSKTPITADFLRRTDTAAVEEFEDVSCAFPAEKKSFLQDIGDFLKEKLDPARWLVDGLLPSGGTSLLVAKPKVGKSTLSRVLAVCVARGLPFLGLNTLKGKVAYLTLEESPAQLQDQFKKLGAEGLTNEIRVFCGGTAPMDLIKQLESAGAEAGLVLIILDPLFKFIRVKDEKNYAEISNALQQLTALARKLGAHLLIVHHAGKTDREDGDNVLGSTAIFASPDTLVTLRKRDGCRMISTVQRYGTNMPETTLSFDPSTGIISLGVERTEAEQLVFEGMIVEWLASQRGFSTADEIYDAVSGRLHLKRKALRSLVDSQRIERTGAGTRGDPFRHRLPSGVIPMEEDVFSEMDLAFPFSDESIRGTACE